MGIQFPPIAFLYLLYYYICIYIFLFCTLVKRTIIFKLKLKLNFIWAYSTVWLLFFFMINKFSVAKQEAQQSRLYSACLVTCGSFVTLFLVHQFLFW